MEIKRETMKREKDREREREREKGRRREEERGMKGGKEETRKRGREQDRIGTRMKKERKGWFKRREDEGGFLISLLP